MMVRLNTTISPLGPGQQFQAAGSRGSADWTDRGAAHDLSHVRSSADLDLGGWEAHQRSRGKKGKKQQDSPLLVNNVDLRYTAKKTTTQDLIFDKRLIRVWSPHVRQEPESLKTFRQLARYPDIYPYIAIMPDYHPGQSSVIGSIIPSINTLYVNAIGGDIGCGMASLRFPLSLDEMSASLPEIYKGIYARVPVGRRTHTDVKGRIVALSVFNSGLEVMNRANTKRTMQQMGTLGSGNHFIELQIDDNNNVFAMVHTGSRILGQHIRTIGARLGTTSQKPRGLITIEADSEAGRIYMEHMKFAVEYARLNRLEILRQVYGAIAAFVPALDDVPFETLAGNILDLPHNYIAREHHFGRNVYVHRKGAIRIPEGERGIIPGSMGTESFIVIGKGNRFSFSSASHGAGRKMSRGEAFSKITREAYQSAMEGILCRTGDSIVDEAPQAYKDICQIMHYQRDLVRRDTRLRPIASIKG